MDVQTDLTITVKVDTSAARQEVNDFQQYALRVIGEIRAAYAALGTPALPGSQPGMTGTRRRA